MIFCSKFCPYLTIIAIETLWEADAMTPQNLGGVHGATMHSPLNRGPCDGKTELLNAEL